MEGVEIRLFKNWDRKGGTIEKVSSGLSHAIVATWTFKYAKLFVKYTDIHHMTYRVFLRTRSCISEEPFQRFFFFLHVVWSLHIARVIRINRVRLSILLVVS